MDTLQPLEGLRLKREQAGLGQAAAGRIIGRSQSHFGKIERGESSLTAADAVQLGRVLGCTVESMFEKVTS